MFLTFTKCCLSKDVLIFECYLYIRELKRNRIKIVESLTFQGLESLKSLKMQRNGINRLMDGAFFGLGNIEELWVCRIVEFLLGTLAVEGCVLYGFPYIKAVLRYWWASQEMSLQMCIFPWFWYHVLVTSEVERYWLSPQLLPTWWSRMLWLSRVLFAGLFALPITWDGSLLSGCLTEIAQGCAIQC